MNIIGKWEVSAIMSFVDGEIKFVNRAKAEDIEDFDIKMFDVVTEFLPDGVVRDMMKIPEGMSQEEIDKLISEEDMERVDDYLVMATHQWKEDDGRFLYNTKIEGEIFGEEVSPWSEILVDDNGEITVADMIRMKKM